MIACGYLSNLEYQDCSSMRKTIIPYLLILYLNKLIQGILKLNFNMEVISLAESNMAKS